MIDLDKFKKIEEGKDCTVLLHDKGHELKIAHKGLSKEFRKQLSELPMHLSGGGRLGGMRGAHRMKNAGEFMHPAKNSGLSGPSKPSVKSSDINIDPHVMPGQKAALNFTEPASQGTRPTASIPGAPGKHEPDDVSAGARNAYYFENGKYPPCINSSCKSYGKPHPNCRCYGPTSQAGTFMAEGGAVAGYCSEDRPHQEGCEYFKAGGVAEGDSAGSDPTQIENQSPPPSPMPQPVPESTPDPSQYPQATPQAEPSPLMPENQSAPQTGQPDPERGPEGVPSAGLKPSEKDPFASSQSGAPKTDNPFEKHLNQMLNEQQNYQVGVDSGRITPKTYESMFHDSSTPSKIGTLFGLLIGGIGSGLGHQPNVIMQMMDNEIQRDVHAQEKSQENRANFLKINQQNFMNVANANTLTQEARAKGWATTTAQMRYAAYDKMARQSLALPPGPLRDKAMQTLMMMKPAIDQENASAFAKAAFASATAEQIFGNQGQGGQPNTALLKSGYAGEQGKILGEDIESKTIPGVPGRAQRPIPQANRDQVQAMNVLDQKARDLISYAKAHEGSWNPKTRAIAQQKANEMVGFYSSSLGTSMTEGTRTWLDDQIAKKNPTSAIAQELFGSSARLQEILDSNSMRKNTMLQSLGFQGSPNPETTQQKRSESTKEGVTATNKMGHKIIFRNGKWQPYG